MLPLSDPEMYDDDDEDDEDWTYEYEDEEEPGPDIEPDTNFTVELPGTSKEPEKGEVKEKKKAATPPDQLHYGDDEYESGDDSYSYVTESYSSSSFEEIDGDVRADVVLGIGKDAEKEKEKNKQEGVSEPPKKEVATVEKNKTPPKEHGPKVKKKPPTEPEPSKEDAKKKGSVEGVSKVKEDGKKEEAEIEKGTKAPPVPPLKLTLKHNEWGEGNATKKSAEEKASATAKGPPAVPPKVGTKGDKTSNQQQKKAAPATLPKPLSSGKKASAATEKTVPVSLSKKAEIGKETTRNAAAPTKPPPKAEAKSGEAAKVASVPPKAPTPLPPRTQPAKSQPPMEIKGSQPFSLPSYQPPPPPRLSRPPMRTRDQPLAKGLWEERTKSIPPPVSNRQFQMARTQSASPTKQMFQSGGGAPGMSTIPTKAIFADRMRAFVQAERAAGITYPTLAISAIKPKPKPPPPAPPLQANLKPVTKRGMPVEQEEKKPVVDTSKSDALARAFLARAKKLAAEMDGRESSPPPPRPLSAPSSSFRRAQQPPKTEPKPDVYKEVAPRVEKPLTKPPQPEEPTKQKAKESPEKKAAAAKGTCEAAPAKKEIQKAKNEEVPKSAEKKATAAKVADKTLPAKKGEAAKAKPGEKKKSEIKKEGAKPTADKEEKKGESKPEAVVQVADSPKEAKPEKEELTAEDEQMTEEMTAEEEEGIDEEYTEVDEEEEYTEVDEEVDEEDEFTEVDEEVDEEEELADGKEGEEEPAEEDLGGEKEGEEAEENEESLDDEEEEEKEEPKKRSKRKRGKKGRKGKKRKKQKSSDVDEGKAEPPELPPKRRWIPPPRTPPEPVPMPPIEKSLCEILKEELRDGITPVKRYAKKVHNEIYLPMVIPWENEAAMQTQAGMGAFGQFRDTRIRIEDGKSGQLVEGSLKSETVLPLFEHNSKNFASQKDQYITSFGAHRRNVENVVDHHEYESEPKVKLSECVIPRVFLPADATQSDMTAFGTNRSQTTKVKYLEGMKAGCDVDSHTFISRQFKANSNENAGSHMMDRRRGVIQLVEGVGEMKHHPITECIVPRFFCNDEIYKKTGSDFGAFRPLVSEVIGGYRMDYDDERLCKLIIPYQTAPSLTSS